jgi:hypothetical protein
MGRGMTATIRSEISQEIPMSRKTISPSPGAPSFFYLMMARSCFCRALGARPPKTGTLRKIGRDYLMKATRVRL